MPPTGIATKPTVSAKPRFNVAVETITPELAALYLEQNVLPQRRVDMITAKGYARDMQAGLWLLSGDPIRFDTQGRLIDGQHRLKAATMAKVSFTTVVIRDMPDAIITVLDSGRKRSAGDLLAFHGHSSGHLLAATSKWLLTMKAMAQTNGKAVFPRSVIKPSHAEVLDVVSKHPSLAQSCKMVYGLMGIRPSILAAIHYVGSVLLEKPELADAFVKVFVQGIGYWEGSDPAIKLREHNIRERQKGKNFTDRTAITTSVYAWNHFAKGTRIVSIRPPQIIKVDGLKPEML